MWIPFNNNPCGRVVGDCAVRAVSVALGLDWEDAFDALATAAFAMCDMPSSNQVIAAVLRKNGFYRKAIPEPYLDRYTAEDFCRDHPTGTYVLSFGNHVCGVYNGAIMDAWDSSAELPQFYYYRKDDQ